MKNKIVADFHRNRLPIQGRS